ncbi:hypothetical protein [Pseudoalteromonas viridis]|uniref:Uncharacterized protein n=1 Tax=Pseudoalteromonas viridis TaxID=339617 RepID=A0ABX7V229_9GAMM|nr:hypothetical protein [Pseudoalteromonas viridis]QTL34495.1 hypothetical protein J5X90_13195 [Pseudoalteromonas viridis]
MANTKKKKREQKLKKAKKALATKKHEANRAAKAPDLNILPGDNSKGFIESMFGEQKQPDYYDIVSKFNGTMDEWYELILQTHNEYGFGFEYEDLEDVLLNLIASEYPEVIAIVEKEYDCSSEAVKEINDNFKHKWVDMLVVTNNQNGEFWSGALEANKRIVYGL